MDPREVGNVEYTAEDEEGVVSEESLIKFAGCYDSFKWVELIERGD